jgi:hypothetical protein
MERIVGFFSVIARLHGTEAAALLFWSRRDGRICFRIPPQRAGLSESWGGALYPTDVRYEVPPVEQEELVLFGSVHSHVDGPAYASPVDRHDETHRTGLHVVVGRITCEPPELHCEYVVDGERFRFAPEEVIEGYERRREDDVPREWIERVSVEVHSYGDWRQAPNDDSSVAARPRSHP